MRRRLNRNDAKRAKSIAKRVICGLPVPVVIVNVEVFPIG
jgi:hypothetical protein